MSEHSSPEITESAKAVQEVAKAGGKAIDAASGLAGFFKQVFGDLVTDSVGIAADTVKAFRHERLHVLEARTRRRLDELNIETTNPVPPRVAVPLIENASLEQDDRLMDMWAGLLANAMNPAFETETQKQHVDLLSALSPTDAVLLEILWIAANLERPNISEPDKEAFSEKLRKLKDSNWHLVPVNRQKQALHNLIRLRLAVFKRDKVITDNLFQHAGGSMQFNKSGSTINPGALERALRNAEWGLQFSAGIIEPMAFQVDDAKDAHLRYSNPERGMSIIASGWFLMKACHIK